MAWNKPVAEKCPEAIPRRRDEIEQDARRSKAPKCGNEWDAPTTEDPIDAEAAVAV